MLLPERLINLTDNELISEFKGTGNKLIIGVIYKRYAHLVFGLSMKYLKDEEDAEDMVIHVFTRLIDDLRKHEIEFFKSWLYTYTKNFCLMQMRSAKSKRIKEQDYRENVKTLMESSEDMHRISVQKEIQLNSLEKAIEELSDEQQKCIRLFYLNEKSYQEIAQETGYSLNNVKSYIQNGKRNLKIKLESMGFNDSLSAILILLHFLN